MPANLKHCYMHSVSIQSWRACAAAVQVGAPQNTNHMGGAWPILVCSTLTSPLLTVPRKGSLWMSGATELASLHSHNGSEVACRRYRTASHACMHGLRY